jgi:ubiquinone/menaquinone biosynthesis C-methylase UbiE
MDIKDYKIGILNTNFWFKAKNELMEQLIGNNKNLKILDLGIGTGGDLKTLNKHGKVYATDINREVLELIPKNLYFKKKVCDATNITYNSNKFDLVILFDVLEHVKDNKKVISEIKRVLKKGGKLLLTVPSFQYIYSSHDKALGHHKRYSKKEIKALLKDFKIEKLGYWNFILFLPIALKRILTKNIKPRVDNMSILPKFLNNIFYKLLSFENRLISKGFNLPFGLTIFAECVKQ